MIFWKIPWRIARWDDVNYYYCNVCRYCFSAEQLPDRCPDCGAVAYNDRLAVRLATNTEIAELLRIRKEDKEDTKWKHINIGHSEHLPVWQDASTRAAKSWWRLTSISLVALWSAWAWQSTPATKLHRRRKKMKSLKNKNTHPRRNKRGLFWTPGVHFIFITN